MTTIIGSRLKSELPKIRIKWMRGRDKIDWSRPSIALCLGKKGSGKSALGEVYALHHHKIIDLFGSRDNESLCWCRDSSPIDDILLVTGNSVDVDSSFRTIKSDDLSYEKMLGYECVLTCNSFYVDQEDRFVSLEKIIDQFWNRFSWERPICTIIREASSFIYSRIKQGSRVKDAKADFIYFQREMRHFGYSLYIDTIRWTSVDKEMRDLADYMILKKVGPQGLPRDISWLYKFADPMSMAALPPHLFLILTENAAVGVGKSELPPFHKEEGVDLIKELGIEIECGERVEESSYQMVGDKEHAMIIDLYNAEKGMIEIRERVHRSLSTISRHLNDHNKAVERKGVCEKCERVGSDLSKMTIHVRR